MLLFFTKNDFCFQTWGRIRNRALEAKTKQEVEGIMMKPLYAKKIHFLMSRKKENTAKMVEAMAKSRANNNSSDSEQDDDQYIQGGDSVNNLDSAHMTSDDESLPEPTIRNSKFDNNPKISPKNWLVH